jgi:hypothetical protein
MAQKKNNPQMRFLLTEPTQFESKQTASFVGLVKFLHSMLKSNIKLLEGKENKLNAFSLPLIYTADNKIRVGRDLKNLDSFKG